MSDEQLPFQLDVIEYDWLILGTGYEESLYSAHLSKIARHSLLVIDFGNAYSANTRTMNLKEFSQIHEELPKEERFAYLHKRPVLHLLDSPNEINNKAFITREIESSEFKYFNIDLQPKLLFSQSVTVDLMQQADMDQYMDFKAIENQFFYDIQSNQFKSTPTSKSDIFKCSFLTLMEKKVFFQLLHQLVKIYHKTINYQIDQNSTQEFDQNTTQIDENTYQIYLQHKKDPALLLLQKLTKSNTKVYEILYYSICFEVNHYEQSKITSEQFIQKLGKYVKSMGIHSKAPFLYTNYGTGDISQGFCRISAVYGGIYITSNKVRINEIKKQEDNSFNLQTNLNEKEIHIKKGIIMSPQVYNSYENDNTKPQQLLRMILITTKDATKLIQETQQDIQQDTTHIFNPSLYVVSNDIITKYPIYIFRTDKNSNSTYKDYEQFHCWTLIEDQDIEILREKIRNLITQIDQKHKDCQPYSQNFIVYEQSFIQDYINKEYIFEPQKNIFVTSQDNYEIDFDTHSKLFMENAKLLSQQDGYFQNKNNNIIQNEQLVDGQELLLNQLQMINNQF